MATYNTSRSPYGSSVTRRRIKMEIILQVSLAIIFYIGSFIAYELLKQTGLIQLLKETIYTHPSYNKIVRIIGVVIEGISISVVGAGVYQYFLDGKIIYSVLIFGTIWITIGSFLKEYNK